MNTNPDVVDILHDILIESIVYKMLFDFFQN